MAERKHRPSRIRHETKEEREARRAREARKARNIREAKEKAKAERRVSYVRKPFAKNSFFCIGLSLAAFFLFAAGLWQAVKAQGQAGLHVAAMGFCSLLVAGFSIWYGRLSMLEKEKNYILARIGAVISAVLILIWLVMIIIGMRG